MKLVEVQDYDLLLRFEFLRQEAFNIKNLKPEESFYYNRIKNKQSVAYALFYNDDLIGGIVLSCGAIRNALIIECIFIENSYQRQGLGTKLLEYIVKNKKKELEKYFNSTFTRCYAEPSKGKDDFYRKSGYKESSICYMRKKI